MEDFKWLGSKIGCYNPVLAKESNVFYQSFSYKNINFNVGDFVMITKQNKIIVYRLICLYQSDDTLQEKCKHRAIVRRYTLAKNLNSTMKKNSINFDKKYEIVEDVREDDSSIVLEEIQKKCIVIFATVDDGLNLQETLKYRYDEAIFYCRYKIDSDKIVPIFSKYNDNFTYYDDGAVLKQNSFTPVGSPNRKRSYTDSPTNLNTKLLKEDDYLNTPRDFLNCSGNIEDTPQSKQLNSPVALKNSSIKRVLNHSFERLSDAPVLPYVVVTPDADKGNNIKVRLRLRKNNIDLENQQNTTSEIPTKIITRRCSSRSTTQKSYVEFFTQNSTPKTRQISYSKTPNKEKSINSFVSHIDDEDLKRNNDLITDVKMPDINHLYNAKVYLTRMRECDFKANCFESNMRKPNIRSLKRYLDQNHKTNLKNNSNCRQTSVVKSIGDENSVNKQKYANRETSHIVKSATESDESSASENDLTAVKSKHNITKIKNKTLCKTPQNKRNLKDTPSLRAKMIRKGTITPSIQVRKTLTVKDNTPLSKARNQLHVSCVPKGLPCREKEFSDIMNFLKTKLLDECGGCMYISGVPGTGKTATVSEVIQNLQECILKKDIPPFKYININGMKITEPRQTYVEIVKQLMGKTVFWEEAQTILENKFVKSNCKTKTIPIIFVIDELDILCTKRQDVIYNLLDWPSKSNSQLIVLTIANTMDLPERLLMGRVTSRLGLTRLTFQPYTYKQLQQIVTERLTGIDAFNPDAIQLVARKVASVSGDARRALDICRRAVEIAEVQRKKTLVSMTHVNEALNAMITQPKIQAIKHCSKLEKLLLQAVIAETERTGVEEVNFASCYTTLISLASLDGFQMITRTVALAAVAKLGACRLLLIDQKCNDIHQRIILNVSSDDVYYALTKTSI